MTFISKFRTVEDGTGGRIVFRHPKTEEWNRYGELQIPSVIGGELAVHQDTLEKRLEFFRLWCVEISGYEDEDGPISVEMQDDLPVDLRLLALWKAFDRGYPGMQRTDLVKNSAGTSVPG